MATHAPETDPIRLVTGDDTDRLDLAGAALTDREFEVRCVSGTTLGTRWRGVPAADVLDADRVPPETTHVLLTATDGQCGCVAIDALLAGLFAFEGDDGPLEGAPRFVAPGIEGPRAVKRLSTLTPMRLGPTESPEDYEHITGVTTD